MRKPEENSLTNKILSYLKETSKDLLIAGVTIIFDPHKLTRGMSLYKNYNNDFYYRKIANLKTSSYFTVRNNTFSLSNKGRITIIKSIIQDKKNAKRWDNKWRAIVFDIPESSRKERNFLRKELKWMGFKEFQHSIWITPHNLEKELLCLLKLWRNDFTGDIRFLRIEKIIDDKDFKKQFQLP